ncbi:hypothetical protein NPIL_216751 [Nephila pilipes]|uniref:Uncharacterized protein n=1 Tax=Nephila pilipes TaxID=299642 RepID=A0A8X6P0W0_NEPPI|nr:hypothetical protein NPIL_216751 [Nephila pilipes]
MLGRGHKGTNRNEGTLAGGLGFVDLTRRRGQAELNSEPDPTQAKVATSPSHPNIQFGHLFCPIPRQFNAEPSGDRCVVELKAINI